jgi:thiol-disulfide isomerase/thioredoxin
MTQMRQHGKSLRIALEVCAVAGLLLALMTLRSHAQPQQQQQPQQLVIRFVRDPDAAPDLKAKDLNGKELKLEAYKGKVVLLNFWATWCGPCRAEIPSLIRIQEAYKDRLQIIGMDVDDDEEQLHAFVKDQGINYPVAMTSAPVRLAYGGIAALPTLFVINQDSKVVQKHVGLFNPALYEIEARALLDMPIPARVESFEDTGEVFLKHADRATMLPGVDSSKLMPEQRTAVLHKLNAETCDCGCKYTLAQCRIYDPACNISKERAAAIVKEAAKLPAKNAPENSAPVSSAPSAPADPPKPRSRK